MRLRSRLFFIISAIYYAVILMDGQYRSVDFALSASPGLLVIWLWVASCFEKDENDELKFDQNKLFTGFALIAMSGVMFYGIFRAIEKNALKNIPPACTQLYNDAKYIPMK